MIPQPIVCGTAKIEEGDAGEESSDYYRGTAGSLVRKVGIMGVVRTGGDVAPGDLITVESPDGAHEPVDRV